MGLASVGFVDVSFHGPQRGHHPDAAEDPGRGIGEDLDFGEQLVVFQNPVEFLCCLAFGLPRAADDHARAVKLDEGHSHEGLLVEFQRHTEYGHGPVSDKAHIARLAVEPIGFVPCERLHVDIILHYFRRGHFGRWISFLRRREEMRLDLSRS